MGHLTIDFGVCSFFFRELVALSHSALNFHDIKVFNDLDLCKNDTIRCATRCKAIKLILIISGAINLGLYCENPYFAIYYG